LFREDIDRNQWVSKDEDYNTADTVKWSETWRKMLVYFFNKRIDEVYSFKNADRFESFIKKLDKILNTTELSSLSVKFLTALNTHIKSENIDRKKIDELINMSNIIIKATERAQHSMFRSNLADNDVVNINISDPQPSFDEEEQNKLLDHMYSGRESSLAQIKEHKEDDEVGSNEPQPCYASKLWNAGYFSYRTNFKSHQMKAFNKHRKVIEATRSVSESKLTTNYSEIV